MQAAFDRLYAGPEAAQQYHAECNKDPEAKVGPWENGKREVVFGLKAPAALARTVGKLMPGARQNIYEIACACDSLLHTPQAVLHSRHCKRTACSAHAGDQYEQSRWVPAVAKTLFRPSSNAGIQRLTLET